VENRWAFEDYSYPRTGCACCEQNIGCPPDEKNIHHWTGSVAGRLWKKCTRREIRQSLPTPASV